MTLIGQKTMTARLTNVEAANIDWLLLTAAVVRRVNAEHLAGADLLHDVRMIGLQIEPTLI